MATRRGARSNSAHGHVQIDGVNDNEEHYHSERKEDKKEVDACVPACEEIVGNTRNGKGAMCLKLLTAGRSPQSVCNADGLGHVARLDEQDARVDQHE
eukprot:781929-Prymnesium_polylepis.1